MAGCGKSGLRMVSGIPARARDGDIQCRLLARIRARAVYCRHNHVALWMAVCVRFHGTGGDRMARAVVDSLPAAAPESVVERGRVLEAQTVAAASRRSPSGLGRARSLADVVGRARLLDSHSHSLFYGPSDLLRHLLASRVF